MEWKAQKNYIKTKVMTFFKKFNTSKQDTFNLTFIAKISSVNPKFFS